MPNRKTEGSYLEHDMTEVNTHCEGCAPDDYVYRHQQLSTATPKSKKPQKNTAFKEQYLHDYGP